MTVKRAVHVSFPKDVLDNFEKVCNRKGISLGAGLRRLAAYSSKQTWLPPRQRTSSGHGPLTQLSAFEFATLHRSTLFKRITRAAEEIAQRTLAVSPQSPYFEKGVRSTLELAVPVYLNLRRFLNKGLSTRSISAIANGDEAAQYEVLSEMLNEVGFRKFFRMAEIMAADKRFGRLSKYLGARVQTVRDLAGSMIMNLREIYVRTGRAMAGLNISNYAYRLQYTNKRAWHVAYHDFLIDEQQNGGTTFANMPLKYISKYDGLSVQALRDFPKVLNFLVPTRADANLGAYEASLLWAAWILMQEVSHSDMIKHAFRDTTHLYTHESNRKLFEMEADYLSVMFGLIKNFSSRTLVKLLKAMMVVVDLKAERARFNVPNTLKSYSYQSVAAFDEQAQSIVHILADRDKSTLAVARDLTLDDIHSRLIQVDDNSATLDTDWDALRYNIDKAYHYIVAHKR